MCASRAVLVFSDEFIKIISLLGLSDERVKICIGPHYRTFLKRGLYQEEDFIRIDIFMTLYVCNRA